MDEFDSSSGSRVASLAGDLSTRDVAQYIQQMSGELSAMADATGLDGLAAGLRVIAAICEAELAELR